MVYITGDMHGDESRLYDKEWRKLKAGDVLIVCGDFGYIWDGGKYEKEAVEYIYRQLRNAEAPDEETARGIIEKLFFSDFAVLINN